MTDMGRPLGEHEGRATVESAIVMPGVAGGLREAFKLQPVEFSQGERVYLVFEAEVRDVTYEAILDHGVDTWTNKRVHKLKVRLGAFVDEASAKPALDAEEEKLRVLRIAAAGQLDLGPEASPPSPEWDDDDGDEQEVVG